MSDNNVYPNAPIHRADNHEGEHILQEMIENYEKLANQGLSAAAEAQRNRINNYLGVVNVGKVAAIG